MLGIEHYSVVNLVLAGEHHFEGRNHFFNAKLRQVTEAAVVDPEDQWIIIFDQPSLSRSSFRRRPTPPPDPRSDQTIVLCVSLYGPPVGSRPSFFEPFGQFVGGTEASS